MTQEATYSQIVEIKKQLQHMDIFLNKYGWLMNSYTTDYFTLKLEKKFPLAFSDYLLKDCSLADLATLLPEWGSHSIPSSSNGRLHHVMPLSMQSFRSLCRSLSLNQDLHSLEAESASSNAVFGTALEKYFRVCVKAKKQHEVDLLSEMLASLCKRNGCGHVVDIGSGLGHLSRLLSFNKHLKVTTIEASGSHTPKARRLDRQTESLMTKQKVGDRTSSSQPHHISHWIDPDISTEEFINLLSNEQPNRSASPTASTMLTDLSNKMSTMLIDSEPAGTSDSGTGVEADLPRFDLPWNRVPVDVEASLYLTNARNPLTSYSPSPLKHKVCSGVGGKHASRNKIGSDADAVCLSGLHACGDLSTTMIRVFVNLSCAKVLSSVGCCYMKLSCDKGLSSSADSRVGFPMSQFVKSLPYHRNMCTYESLEMACHFVSQYRQRLINEEVSLRRHVCRAVLQTLLYRRKNKSEIQFKRLKIKNSEQLPFKEYAERAFTRLGLVYDVTDSEVAECEAIINSHWRAVVGAYTVRLALAPVVEAYVLLDRMVYLWEQGISSRLIPVFDSSISPRNMALVAVKSS